jgi:chemotaxis protein MotB
MRSITACAVLLLAFGCVSRGTYHEVVAERDRLEAERRQLSERVEKLQASNQSLSSERIQLLEEVEDLSQQHDSLQARVRNLRSLKTDLEADLKAREAELATHSAELQRIQGTYEALVADLEQEVAAGQVHVTQLREGLWLNLSDEILFPSGSAQLLPQGRAVIRKVAAQLHGIGHRIEVQGHTDNVPIQGDLAARYPTNWELASARATQVVRLLEAEKIEPQRLTAVSFGETHPIAPNDTDEGRARNRRIEIRLIPLERESAAASGR